MTNVIYTVIDGVYDRTVGVCVNFFAKPTLPKGVPRVSLPVPTDFPKLSSPTDELVSETQSVPWRSVARVLDDRSTAPPPIDPRHSIVYMATVEAPLFGEPREEFDGALAFVPYGTMLMALSHEGRWTKVAWGDRVGWVLKDDLVDQAVHIFPSFIDGEKNEAEDVNTVRVRALLRDEFGGDRMGYPLQAGEYVSYRLLRRNITIPWPPERPRWPGRWHTLLKGVARVHSGVQPKTGAVMEYVDEREIGQLAYVEAVFPDESITVSQVNEYDSGIYRERTLVRAQWRELRPVFIQIM